MRATGSDGTGARRRLRPAGPRPATPRRRACGAGRRGQVLIVTIIAMSLLVGLVFYVYNVGDQVNRRLQIQGSADSVAITGAVWMARNMNIVGMDNVGMAKLLSLVPVLDTQPLSTAMAYEETNAWASLMESVIEQPHFDNTVSPETEDYVRQGIVSLQTRMREQASILEPYHEAINLSGFNMEETTHWAYQGGGGSPPHGALWRATMTLEELTRASVESCGVLAQARASRFGQENGGDAAFLVPVIPQMPAREGQYMDFQPPIEGKLKVESERIEYSPSGGKGGAIPDVAFPHRLGPWARLHKWRDYNYRFIKTGERFVPGAPGAGKTRGSNGNVDVKGRRVGWSARRRTDNGRPDRVVPTGFNELLGYTTYGPYEWAKRHIHWWARGTHENPGKLRDTYYYTYLANIGKIKLEYQFPAGGVGEEVPTKQIHYPQWVTDYPTCKQIAEDDNNRVTSTMYYLFEIASKYPEGSPGYLTQGTFRTNGHYPIAMWINGWKDPNDLGLPLVSNWVWRDTYVYETTQDNQLGIPRETDANGDEIWQPVYMNAWYIFGGIDIGGEVEVSNPCNWDRFDRLPVPFLLDTARGEYSGDDPDAGFRRDSFMYLGIARKGSEAPVWPQRFSNVNPLEGMLTVAQAKVFNNKSWGLWTQDWRAQLAPVTEWQDWISRLEDGIGEAGNSDVVDTAEVETAYQYLSALNADLAALYLSH